MQQPRKSVQLLLSVFRVFKKKQHMQLLLKNIKKIYRVSQDVHLRNILK